MDPNAHDHIASSNTPIKVKGMAKVRGISHTAIEMTVSSAHEVKGMAKVRGISYTAIEMTVSRAHDQPIEVEGMAFLDLVFLNLRTRTMHSAVSCLSFASFCFCWGRMRELWEHYMWPYGKIAR